MSPAAADVLLSVVIPVYEDEAALQRLLSELATLGTSALEVVVVDAGDGNSPAAGCLRLRRLKAASPNRGAQLALGARAARGEWLWFLHADSASLEGAYAYLRDLTAPAWGRFDVRLVGANGRRPRLLRLVAALMAWRSRLTGICTGDQGLFVHRSLLAAAGGVPEQPLMEDIELSRRLKRLQRPRCPQLPIETAARRWERHGVLRTVLAMWWLRARYFFGASPGRLAQAYYRER